MSSFLDTLSTDEQSVMIDSISQIAILIAGADGHIDDDELDWAKKITEIRGFAASKELQDYYDRIGIEFGKQMVDLKNEMPDNTEERCKILSDKLSHLNPILAKLDNALAHDLYTSYVSFAKHVAKASGGFLRMWSISKEEKRWIDLPMLTPVVLIEEQD